MEIRDLEVVPLSYTLADGDGLSDARGFGHERSTTLLRIETADGTVGWEAFALGPIVRATVDELFRDVVVGMDPLDATSLAERSYTDP